MSIDLNQKFIVRSSGIGVRLWRCIFKVPGDARVACVAENHYAH